MFVVLSFLQSSFRSTKLKSFPFHCHIAHFCSIYTAKDVSLLIRPVNNTMTLIFVEFVSLLRHINVPEIYNKWDIKSKKKSSFLALSGKGFVTFVQNILTIKLKWRKEMQGTSLLPFQIILLFRYPFNGLYNFLKQIPILAKIKICRDKLYTTFMKKPCSFSMQFLLQYQIFSPFARILNGQFTQFLKWLTGITRSLQPFISPILFVFFLKQMF